MDLYEEYKLKLIDKYDKNKKEYNTELTNLFTHVESLKFIAGNIIENLNLDKVKNSLVIYRFIQSLTYIDDIITLLMTGYYTSCLYIIRYYLESIIQSYYLDTEHPQLNIENKLYILKEISDKREYYIARILEKIKISNKDTIRATYKSLSIFIHPTHMDFPTIEELMKSIQTNNNENKADKIMQIQNILINTYDVLCYIVLIIDKDIQTKLRTQESFKTHIDKSNMKIIKKIFIK